MSASEYDMETTSFLNTNIESKCTDADELDQQQVIVLNRSLAAFGYWQGWHCFILSLFQVACTFHLFMFVFQTVDKTFWCARSNVQPNMDVSTWINLTQPINACTILTTGWNNAIADQFIDEKNYTACTEFEYATDDGSGVTLVQEFDLVCDRRNLLSVVEMCFLAGAAIGSVASGWISDKFGRKHTLMSFLLVQALCGTIAAFSTSLAMYMTIRVIIGFASMTVTVVSFVLVVELVSGKWRTIIGILNIVPVAVTYILAAGIAYFIRDWRVLQIVITLPGWALLTTWYCVPESPRWLLARGRLSELYALIERAAHMNGTTLPPNYQKSLEAAVPVAPQTKTSPPDNTVSAAAAERKVTTETTVTTVSLNTGDSSNDETPDIDCNANPFVVVFNKQYWRTTCLTLIVWLTLIIIYFGLTLHLSNLGGNIYVNTTIAGSVEVLSICISIFIVLKLGIRRSLIAYMLIPGVCCLAVNLVPSDNSTPVIVLAMIAKCVIGANNAIIPTYTAMQYPTIVRNFGVGMGNLAAGVALILVPYMWLLEHVQPMLPMSIMGVCGIIGGLALMLMKDVE